MRRENVEADVLCVGGGIVGLMAAIRASELGAKVVVAEKGNTLYSGAARAGDDHFMCYIPEVHGPDVNSLIDILRRGQMGPRMRDSQMVRAWFEKAFDMVKLWDGWGIPMKYEGKWEFAGHAFPGQPRVFLKYSGKGQKGILQEQALKRGVEIINRVMVFELLGDDSVSGAIGIGTREDKIIVFKAKSVVLGTGGVTRLYPAPTPGWMFNLSHPASATGDGRAMAYRLGAELADMEMAKTHAGPKYFARGGQATWVGVVKDPQGKPVGPFVTKPDRRYGDMIIEVNKNLFAEYMKSGKGPAYMDCTDLSDEDYKYMMYWLSQEGNDGLLNHLKEEGIDVRKNPIEFMTYDMNSLGRIHCNWKTETSVKGLYATGDETAGGISIATTFGWIAGENAANYAKEAKPPEIEKSKAKIEEKVSLVEEIQSRGEGGPNWKEFNIALQQIMNEYVGAVRSETLLEAGLTHLRRLKEKAYTTMTATNPHELGRGLEVLNLLDVGEAISFAARERKETRGLHIRADYPYINPMLDKLLTIKKVDDKPVTEWRELPR